MSPGSSVISVVYVIFRFMESKAVCDGLSTGSAMSTETGAQTGACKCQEHSPRPCGSKQLGLFETVLSEHLLRLFHFRL